MTESAFTTVYKSINPAETRLMAAFLESEGIESFVDDQYVTQVNWLYSTALGGVGLRVRSEDAQKARSLLQQVLKDEINIHEAPQTTEQTEQTEQAEQAEQALSSVEASLNPPCPECGGRNTTPQHLPLLGVLGYLINLPLLFPDRYKCKDCGARWKDQ